MQAEAAHEAEEKARRRGERHAREKAEAEERERKEAEERRTKEAEKRQQEAAESKRRHTQQQQQQRERFARGPWTSARALERYKTLCETFDVARFDEKAPLAFERVPWPVLMNPLTLSVEDIDWSAVEAFFGAVRPSMRSQDFKACHHPRS